MKKTLKPNYLRQAEANLCYRVWWVPAMDPGHTLEDLLEPTYWLHCQKLHKHDLVRVRDHAGKFDMMFVVLDAVPGSGAVVRPWPMFPPLSEESKEVHDPVSIARLAEDETKKTKTAQDLGFKSDPRVEHTEGSGWRVIGINNIVVRDQISNEAEADRLLDEYMTKMRLSKAKPKAKEKEKA